MTRTNAFTLLCVAIRAIVVWVFAGALVGLPIALTSMRIQQDHEGIKVMLAVMGGSLLLLAVVWLFADKLARLALARPQDQVFESDLEPEAWMGLAISVIGAWFLFLGLKDLAYQLFQWIMLSRAQVDVWNSASDSTGWTANLLTTLVEMGLAIVFLLRGPGLARLLRRWRYGPTADDATP